jgi:MFS family permease
MSTPETLPNQSAPQSAGVKALLGRRNFRLLWIGEAISLIGDQFYLIALPWLVLQLTGDALAMGLVLALAGVSRAVFMLVGGAITDRFSPRAVMLASNLARLVLVAALALLVLANLIQLWMIYLLALAFGLMDAFFFPAQSAIVPRLVDDDQLQPANAIMQGTAQLSLFLGPVLAGALISVFSGQTSSAVPDFTGIGIAFLVDALTFLASAVTLWFLRDGFTPAAQPDGAAKDEESLLAAIRAGLRAVWRDPALRAFFLLIALSYFLVNGPLFVGIPVLADTRFPEGAAAFGIIMSAFGAGSLLGTILAGLLPRPRLRTMGIVLGVIWSGLGLGVLALGLTGTTALAAATVLAMGIAQGYVVILFVTWLQQRTGADMLGRMMSLLMFASVGLQPLSNLLTGALVGLNSQALFMASGALMAAMVFLFMLDPDVRSMEARPAPVPVPVQAIARPGSVRSARR